MPRKRGPNLPEHLRVGESEPLDRQLEERDSVGSALDEHHADIGQGGGNHDARKPGARPEVVDEARRAHEGSGSETVQDVPLADPTEIRPSHRVERHRTVPQQRLEPDQRCRTLRVQSDPERRGLSDQLDGLAGGCFT